MQRNIQLWVVAVGLFVSACFGTSEDRAVLDRFVGRAEGHGLSVLVQDGNASVRSLTYGTLSLRASAPNLQVDLAYSAGGPSEWNITISNAMPGSRLIAVANSEEIPIEQVLLEMNGQSTVLSCRVPSLPEAGLTLFLTAPPPDPDTPWRFAVINDPHGANGIRTILTEIQMLPNLKMVLSAGDICGKNTAAAFDAVETVFEEAGIPFYAAPGNTDVSRDGPSTWHERFGRHSGGFEYGGVDFLLVDSASASVAPSVYDEIETRLETDSNLRILVTHVPPLDPLGSRNGGFRSRNEAGKFLSLCARGSVDLLLCGHLHRFERLTEGGIDTVIGGGNGDWTAVEVHPEEAILRLIL